MALKDDDKKKKLAAAAKSSSAKSTSSKSTPATAKNSIVTKGSMPTYSGKPALSNPFETRKTGMAAPAKPKAVSSVMVQPSPKMGKDPSGSANFDKTSPSRATFTAGPAEINYGGKTKKSTGGTDMSKGDVLPKKQGNSTAKVSGLISKGPPKTTVSGNYPNTGVKNTNSVPWAIAGGAATLGAGVALTGVGKKIVTGAKKLVKYVAKTKERREARKQQNADNEAFIAERKAKAEAKNPSTPVAKVKASKRTMKNIKRLKKQ